MKKRPAHAYTYPFEPNPDWSSFYAGSDEIWQYFKSFEEKYGLSKFIKTGAKVTSAEWDQTEGKCKVFPRPHEP